MSTSYAPKARAPEEKAFAAALRALFDAHAEADAKVRIAYATVVVWGRLRAT